MCFNKITAPALYDNLERPLDLTMVEVIYGGHCILHLSAIYNYAVDIVSLWCQIAHASVTVTCSLNPDLVEDRRPFDNKSSSTKQ